MILKTLSYVGLSALAIGSTVALADAASIPVGPDTTGSWECTAADNTQHQWVHAGPTQALAQVWAIDACHGDADYPRSCRLLPANCHLVDAHGKWRCFSADYRDTIHWRATREAPRWHALHAAYQQCYKHSPRPETCYVTPAVCRHF